MTVETDNQEAAAPVETPSEPVVTEPDESPAPAQEDDSGELPADDDFRAQAVAMLARAMTSDEPETEPEAQPEGKEEPKTEPPPPPVVKTEDPFAAKLEQLAKEQQRMRAALEASEARLKEREAALAEREQKLLTTEDPLSLLEAHGYTFEDVNNFVLNNKQPTAEMRAARVERELKKLRDEQAAERKAAEETAKSSQAKAAEERFKARIADAAKVAADKFELVNTIGSPDMVYAIIDSHARETGEWLGGSDTEAIRLALEKAEEMLEKQLAPLLQTKKIRGKIQPEVTGKAEAQAQVKTAPKTLTNSLTGRAPPRAQDEEDIDPEVLKAKFAQALRRRST